MEDKIIKQKLPSKIEIATGQPLNLQAKLEGHPLPEVQWLKDGIKIESNEDVKIIKKPDGTVALNIEQARPEDSGKYELKAIGPKGESTSYSDVVVGGIL